MPYSDKYWQKEEVMPPKEIEELQFKRLKWVIRHAYDNVPFYRQRLKKAGVHPDDIKRREDIAKIPFTTKEHLRENYPFGLFAVPKEKIIRIHTSSGTSGKPKVVGYTRSDLENWINMVARCLYMVGVRERDVFQNMVSYTFFTGGLGFHYAAELIGAMVVPAGTGNTERQIRYMLDFGTTVIHATPSYAMHIKEVAEAMGIKPDEIGLKIGCFGAEPWSDNTRKRLEDAFGLKAYDSYGLSEMNGPGVAFECEEQNGLHIWADHYFIEIVDEEGNPAAEGEKGELVLTPLTKEALPLLRYKTGDITFIMDDECSCGRTHPKIHRILGRADDMIVVRGINVFPSQIEHVLMQIPEVGDHFQVVITRRGSLDELTVRVEVRDEIFTGELADLDKIRQKVQRELQKELGLRTNVELVEKGTLERFVGKAKRVLDLREEV
ncbi:phenylacetate--CoA ligase family protein [Archaeoglobus veneficus]|uniref:Phenylacetate--CoA ligase n=1 Tax=Archaeoglobus veneficus (strain DSM 11195 / SNP6) TaxID=693661 RepID=F2KP89_ARCVS|nr:phenylacetate--CoA ligase [Archaeoglobus veneficus]AEA47493.1 Phenylacetate--CoA ligase [Archaeoglobus veneficus SNP6]